MGLLFVYEQMIGDIVTNQRIAEKAANCQRSPYYQQTNNN